MLKWPVGVSEPLCEILEASAQPALNAAGQLERLADERLAGNASQLQQQHDWSQGPHEPDTHDLSGQPIYGSPISEQLRAPGTHMRVRRSPQLEEAAAQDSQATQTAEHSSGALPAEQLLPPNMHGLFSIEEADLSGVRPEGLDAPDASAPHHEASRPDIQPPEPGLHSAGELSAAELSAAERSATERRRQSRHFVAQVARESAALQAAPCQQHILQRPERTAGQGWQRRAACCSRRRDVQPGQLPSRRGSCRCTQA